MTNYLHSPQPVTKEPLQEISDYLTFGFWRDTGELKDATDDPQERTDTNYIDGNPREEREFTYQLHGMSEVQEELIETALQTWEDVANIEFKRIPNNYVSDHENAANITFVDATISDSDSDAGQASGFAWGNSVINVPDFAKQRDPLSKSDEDLKEREGFTDEEASYLGAVVHEIGRVLGLGHLVRYNSHEEVEEGHIVDDDSSLISVMSYVHLQQQDYGSLVPITPQMADIQAMQYLYGAAETRTGDTTYGFNINADDFGRTADIYDFSKHGGGTSSTINDSGGFDTLDVSGFDEKQFIDLQGGSFSDVGGEESNIGIWIDAVIEAAKGGEGVDIIMGNETSNALYGNGGNDQLYGLAGDDILFGDSAVASATGGDDYLEGGDGNDVLYGMAGNDMLYGGDGDDSLFGFAGDDELTGDEGADRFIFELHPNAPISCWGHDKVLDFKPGVDKLVFAGGPASVDDLHIAEGNFGTEIAYGDNTVSLLGCSEQPGNENFEFLQPAVSDHGPDHSGNDNSRPHVEEGSLSDHDRAHRQNLKGGDRDDVIEGSDGVDKIFGFAGNDILYGKGGGDLLVGGDGDDILIGGAGADVLKGGEGADRFVFDLQPDAPRVDWEYNVLDFKPGVDKLVFLGGPASADDLQFHGAEISYGDKSVYLSESSEQPGNEDFEFLQPAIIA